MADLNSYSSSNNIKATMAHVKTTGGIFFSDEVLWGHRNNVMIIQYPKTVDQGKPDNENADSAPQAGRVKEEACRCKETAHMTPRQLFGLMISDLAFWKKEKKR